MSSSESTSFIIESPTHDSDDDIDSLPSTDSHSSLDDAELDSDAEREWRESLQQIELLLTMVVVPYLGKYFGQANFAESDYISAVNDSAGRKCAYWGWAKFMEWKYPGLEVSITNPKLFKAAGAVEAAAAL
jgi:hypothetical protein